MNEKNLGIELIEKFSLTVINSTNEVIEDFKDGKLQIGEIAALIPDVISLAKQGLNWKNLLAQISDFSTDEGIQYANFLIENGIANDKVDTIIIHIAGLANKLFIAYVEDIAPILEAIKK